MEYSYSRSVTVRAYGFLIAFSAWTLYHGHGMTGSTGSALMILIVSSVVALAFLLWWRQRRLWIEFAVVAVLVGVFYPLFYNFGQGAENQVGRDALMIGSFVAGALLVFGKVPDRWFSPKSE